MNGPRYASGLVSCWIREGEWPGAGARRFETLAEESMRVEGRAKDRCARAALYG